MCYEMSLRTAVKGHTCYSTWLAACPGAHVRFNEAIKGRQVLSKKAMAVQRTCAFQLLELEKSRHLQCFGAEDD